MRKEQGIAHILLLILLLAGIVAGVYLIQNKTNLFSRASTDPIVFKSTSGQTLPKNSSGVPQTTSSSVKVEFTSPLGPPKPGVSGPVSTYTVSFRFAENPTDLDKATYLSYSTEPRGFNYTFNPTLGTKFIWAEFKDNKGKTERRSAQIEIISATATPTPSSFSRVFVTSTTYSGNLGGLAGADSKCQARANAANLGGTWKAWLSDSKTSASSRLTHSGPYLLVNGTKVFTGWGNSWGGISYGAALSPINMTELKTTVSNNVWTNTSYNGGITNKTLNQVCNDWTNSDAKNYGYYGMSGQRSLYWTSKARQTCNINSSLYCFEQ